MTRQPRVLVLLALVVVAAVALGIALAQRAAPPNLTSAVTSEHCKAVDGLPDHTCTPGAVDPRVTQDNIDATICVSGYTKTVRPPSGYTSALKVSQIRQYGYSDTDSSHYEEDHLIPLELGGHPTDPRNLWPEPLLSGGATRKDTVENRLHSEVCARLISLSAAQATMATDWTSAT